MQKLLHTLYITEPDTVLRRDGEALVAVHANGREDHIPLHLLDRIVCFSGASISPAVIDACVKHDVGFSALSQSGRFCFRLNGPTTGNVLLRKKQYTAMVAAVGRRMLPDNRHGETMRPRSYEIDDQGA